MDLHVLGEARVRLQIVDFSAVTWKAAWMGSALGSGVTLSPYFQKCLLFSKQFMHQGNVAETTR